MPDVSVGNTYFNKNAVIEFIEQNKASDVIVFPELCTTGYTCADLFFQSELIKSSADAINEICRQSTGCKAVIFCGAPLTVDGMLFNCAFCIHRGKIYGIVPKTFIPNYNEFYEKRWFSSASELKSKTISSKRSGFGGDYEIPIGTDIIFDVGGQVSIGCEICEDLWAPIPPSSTLAVSGAELIVNLSASNETISKRQYRKNLVKHQSGACICAYAYASAGAKESTTDLIFSGHSIICENGNIASENDELISTNYALTADVDIGKIRADRLKLKTFKDASSAYPGITAPRRVFIDKSDFCGDGTRAGISKLPFVPSLKADRLSRCKDIFDMQVMGLKKRTEITGGKLVIGVSGGLDSTLALLVCAMTARKANLPMTDVVGITMPCFGTTNRTYNNALTLMKTLGISYKEINIKKACLTHFSDTGQSDSTYDLTYENSQARERTQVLMDYAGKVGGFVVGTGDLSELALGWCTYNADHMSMYGVNSSIPKTLVRWMVESVIEYDLFPDSTEVLKDIIDTPISPELLPPDESGNISQETESIVGPYALHDFFLYYVLRYGFEPKKIEYLANIAFKDDFDSQTIKKWLKNFYKRFFSQQFKRSCLPDGVKVGSICLSPRGDWRMPSDASSAVWLEEI